MQVLVTGASRGIGRAVAERLIADDHHVIGLSRSFDDAGDELPDSFSAGQFERVEIDLADLDRLPDRLKEHRDLWPRLDAVVFNAGRGEFGHLEQFSYQQIRSLVDLNFLSAAYLARALLPSMKERGHGDLIFIGSEAALEGKRRGSIYCASKFALRGFAQALRDECSSSGVRVTILQPGMVRTSFFDELDFDPGDDPENYLEPEDIADAIQMVLAARRETVFDEIRLSPLKKVIKFRKRK